MHGITPGNSWDYIVPHNVVLGLVGSVVPQTTHMQYINRYICISLIPIMAKRTRYNHLNVGQIQEQLDRLSYWSSDESEIEDDNDDDDPIYRYTSSSSS